MTCRRKSSRRGAAFMLAAMAAALTTGASAQTGSDLIYLQDRVERLESQLQMYGQSGGTPMGDTSEAGLSLRIGQLEEQMRQINGQVEQFAHQIRQIDDRLRRMSEDTEYRFQELGGGSGAMPPRSERQQTGEDELAGSGDGSFYGSGDTSTFPEAGTGTGTQPQILGQVPGRPLDLSGALGQPLGDYGRSQPEDLEQWPGAGNQMAAAPTGDPRDDYDTAYGHVLRGEFDVAEASFRQFLTSYPGDELAGNAQYWLGEALFARGRYRDAADAFLAGYTEHPESAKAADSLFKLGMSLKELGQRDAACATLAEIERKYPGAPQAVRERAQSELDKSGC